MSRDPQLLKWGKLMPRHGGSQQMSFPPAFSEWLHQQLIMVDDWAYVGMGFRGDPDLQLPRGA